MKQFTFILLTILFGSAISFAKAQTEMPLPNFIIVFCDDLGYGDIGTYGSKINRTPNIDRMADEGMKFTSFYASASVCSPSRASLLTGCYPQRVDMAEARPAGFRSVLLAQSQKGLNPAEITIAEILKAKGYATACIGKWHVGEQEQFLPTRQGFDYFFGTPGSNNFKNLPLMESEKVVEQPADQSTLTKRYTELAIEFMEKNKEQPFFIYLPHNMPHDPLHASEAFRGRSEHGIYSDAIEEIDWSVGEILDYVKENNMAENTFVFFTSDNGGEARFGGINDPLRGGKGTTWEGGMRVPGIAWWPGKIPAGQTTDEIATIMDFLPTFHELVYGEPFSQVTIDGHNIWPLLTGVQKESPYQAFFYYDRDQLQAVRAGKWKLHLPLEKRFKAHYTDDSFAIEAELYNLETDISESNNVAEEHPEIVKQLMGYAQWARQALGDRNLPSPYVRPAGMVTEIKALEKEEQQ
jgi:arylsulfatase A